MATTSSAVQSRPPVKFGPHSSLFVQLRAAVDGYLDEHRLRADGGRRILGKTAVFIGWFLSSYVLLVLWASSWWQVVPLAISLGLAQAGIGFCIQHDGGHGAFSSSRLGNRLSAFALDLMGGSSYFWNHKHNLLHHHHPNIDGMDDDLDAAPFLRLAPTQPHRPIHRFQHLYVWFLLAFFPLKWALYDDFWSLARRRVGCRSVPRPRGGDLALFVLGKVAFVGWAIVIPFSLHPLGPVVLTLALVSTVSGVVLATVFQLAHCVEEAVHLPTPADQRVGSSWAEHQLATTVDFAPENAVLCWYLGGLNHQVEHHLFPKVSHVHYRGLHPIIKRVCEENDVRHRTNRTLMGAIASHVRFLKRMGRPTVPTEA